MALNFGGVSVGGIEKNRAQFNKFLPEVYHLSDTHNLKKMLSQKDSLNGVRN